MTQTEWILKELRIRPLTPIDALNGCGCFRLAARIADLRNDGHEILTKNLHLPNGKTVAQYRLLEVEAA